MLCFSPMLALLAVVTLHPNDAHRTNMNGAQVEGQTCVQGFGLYATAASSELYTGGIQYGYPVPLREHVTLIGQVYVGASYPSRWVPELPNQVQFDTGLRVLVRWHQMIAQVAWQHDSNAGLGKEIERDGWRYGNTGLDLIKVGVGWEF